VLETTWIDTQRPGLLCLANDLQAFWMDQVQVADDISAVIALFLEFDLPIKTNCGDPGEAQLFTMIFVELRDAESTHGV
jgi:hypothetical protein